jgi:integrase
MSRMGRTRKQTQLPKYVIKYHGAFYYRGPATEWKRKHLGRNFADAMRAFADLHQGAEPGLFPTLGDVFDRYLQTVIPLKAAATQKSNLFELTNLRKALGHMRPSALTPVHVYSVRDAIAAKHGIVQSNLHLALLKHIIVKGIEWGAMKEHPARDVRKLPVLARDRDVSDSEFQLVRTLAPATLQVAMDLVLLTGMSRGDILALTRAQCLDDGIHYTREKTRRKTPRKIIVGWSPELRSVVERAKRIEPEFRRHIVATDEGKQFSASGFSTAWQRLMVKATKAGLEERFHFHDLRAKSATDTEDLMEASERLGHSSPEITKRVYRRKAARVKPLR